MKLIALQRISEQVQPGVAFEIPDEDTQSAEALILGGYARHADPEQDAQSPRRRSYHRRDLKAED